MPPEMHDAMANEFIDLAIKLNKNPFRRRMSPYRLQALMYAADIEFRKRHESHGSTLEFRRYAYGYGTPRIHDKFLTVKSKRVRDYIRHADGSYDKLNPATPTGIELRTIAARIYAAYK